MPFAVVRERVIGIAVALAGHLAIEIVAGGDGVEHRAALHPLFHRGAVQVVHGEIQDSPAAFHSLALAFRSIGPVPFSPL